MTKLILEHDLLNAPKESPARIIAQAQTTMTLSWLIDSHGHKAALLQFMHDAHLINNQNPVISFSPSIIRERERSHNVLNYLTHWEGVKLYGADLHDTCLCQIDLRKADLRKADLSEANLENTNLIGAKLHHADLTGANLLGTDLNGANLIGAIVTNEQLAEAKSLKGAIMPDGKIYS